LPEPAATEVGAVIKTYDELVELADRILRAAGADESNARTVAEHLAGADLCGAATHGVCHLPGYVSDVRESRIDPRGKPHVLAESGATALVSGGWTFGQVGAQYAAEKGAELAQSSGVALVGLVEAHHTGRLGHYSELLAARGFVSLMWSGGYGEADPHTVPFGGRDRLLGTNPITMGAPGTDGPSLMYDFATTTVAGMKVHNAARRGERLPPGSIVGPNGRPSNDPADFFAGGGHLPFGAHKGYAIAMGAEWLGRILTGSDQHGEGRALNPILGRQGVSLIVIRADVFVPMEAFVESASQMVQRTHAVRPAPGVERVLVPGEIEQTTRERQRAEGIPMEAEVWSSLLDLQQELGA
jgi:LDH2 family malate/lactate/ureidoglycolate dehydrogenase